MTKGYLMLVLHAHLPFIRHPEYEDFLEENWLFEAITDTYIPLINVFDGLIADKIDFRITVSLSPTLLAMLRDELLISKYMRHLNKLIVLAEKEVARTRPDRRINDLAMMYLDRFRQAKYVFAEKYGTDLIQAFRKFQELGKLEIITCCATHGYLPLLEPYKPAIKAQVRLAVSEYKEVFGKAPAGMWLPECGYYPGHDNILQECGIRYFFVETHGILFGEPRPVYGIYSPYMCSASDTIVFGRDMESSRAVWSAKEGYPGDKSYREYYRDIGFDLDYDYIKPYINAGGSRVNTGIKYHRITGRTDDKDIYDRRVALATAEKHAEDFITAGKKRIERLAGVMDRVPVITALYDAELFGHWWFEGPEWLDSFLRKIHYGRDTVKTVTPGEYLDLYDNYPVITPSASSWGWKGYSEVWLNSSNDWIYRHIHKMTELMSADAAEYTNADKLEKRTLNQMARELLLAQSSDWAFIMKTGTFADYARGRVEEHISRFFELHTGLKQGNIDDKMLKEAEEKYNLFKNIDYHIFIENKD